MDLLTVNYIRSRVIWGEPAEYGITFLTCLAWVVLQAVNSCPAIVSAQSYTPLESIALGLL